MIIEMAKGARPEFDSSLSRGDSKRKRSVIPIDRHNIEELKVFLPKERR